MGHILVFVVSSPCGAVSVDGQVTPATVQKPYLKVRSLWRFVAALLIGRCVSTRWSPLHT